MSGKSIVRAYDNAQLFYDYCWGTRKNMGINYGYWTPTTKNISEAIHNLHQLILDGLDLDNHSILLDAGCGVGGLCLKASQSFECQTIGINLSSHQIDICKKNSLQHPSIFSPRWIVGDYLDIPLNEASISDMVAVESLFHASEKVRFSQEAYRLLMNNGQLVIADYFLSPQSGAFTVDDWNTLHKWWQGYEAAPLITMADYQIILETEGFVIEKVLDISPNVLKSSKKISTYGKIGYHLSRILKVLGIKIGLDEVNALSAILQYETLVKSLWSYQIIWARKK